MDPEVRVNAINKEVRGLFNRGAFSLVHFNAVPLHANIIVTRIITRLKHFGTIDEEAKARLIIMPRRREEPDRVQCSDCISCIYPHLHQLRCNQRLSYMD
jgi:hypothetical protein